MKTEKDLTNKKQNKIILPENLFYFDVNFRIYEKDGIKSNSPIYSEHFRKAEIVSEDDKRFHTKFGHINKKTMEYSIGKFKCKVFTEQGMLDDIYIAEWKYKISNEILNIKNANLLREIKRIVCI